MEDDEEVQSPPPSPPPRPNGRITVAVAATPQPVSTLTLALPIQQPKSGGGREDCWSEAATAVLIEAWGSRHLDLSRGNLKQEHWKEVADVVNSRQTPDSPKIPRTHVQCKNRIDTVKKKFKLENSKIGPSKWPFYKRLHQLIGPATTTKIASSMSSRRQKVPMGIPVGTRSAVQYRRPHKPSNKSFRRRKMPAATDSDSSQSEPDSTDSFPPERKRPKFHKEVKPKPKPKPTSKSKSRLKSGREKWGGGGSAREVTRAILRFGEAYEHAEISKLEQAVEMEKQRMKFTKELELQRMQFFMKTQLELSRLNHDQDEERWGEEPSSP